MCLLVRELGTLKRKVLASVERFENAELKKFHIPDR